MAVSSDFSSGSTGRMLTIPQIYCTANIFNYRRLAQLPYRADTKRKKKLAFEPTADISQMLFQSIKIDSPGIWVHTIYNGSFLFINGVALWCKCNCPITLNYSINWKQFGKLQSHTLLDKLLIFRGKRRSYRVEVVPSRMYIVHCTFGDFQSLIF